MQHTNSYTVVFDLGGVLIDWNPRHLYRKLIATAEEMEYFLRHICTPEWNEQQDAGRPFRDGVAQLQQQFPQHAELIAAYDQRWEEMLGDANWETVQIVQDLKQAQVPLYALSNWSAEKFSIARRRYDFLQLFDDLLISGEVKLKKPDPRIFRLLLEKYGCAPQQTIFIDDVERNLQPAVDLGMVGIHFKNASQLRSELQRLLDR